MLSFSAESPALSARLYAEGFSLSQEDAEKDLAALLSAGAIPLTLSACGTVRSQGVGIKIDTDRGAMLYLYALTTDQAARGQGLLRTLLRETAALAKKQGYIGLCLLPADDALRSAYRRMGFTEERPAGGAPLITAATDLALYLDKAAEPLTETDGEALYAALGQHMTRAMLDYTLSTLAPAVLPMKAMGGYALALACAPHHALAASSPAKRIESHTLLAMPLGNELPSSIPEPLPR